MHPQRVLQPNSQRIEQAAKSANSDNIGSFHRDILGCQLDLLCFDNEGLAAMNHMMEEPKSSKVLSVGLACVDFINVVAQFPGEDSDKRGENYYWQRGGNASNLCTVLRVLSTPCDFMGVLGKRGAEASWVVKDFEKYNIGTDLCVYKDVQCPVATAILSKDTGTRTIIYYPRDQPELSYEDFNQSCQSHLSSYSWVHFEMTRNVSDVCKMVDLVTSLKSDSTSEASASTGGILNGSDVRLIVSVEIEKPDLANPEQPMGKADVVFVSKDFAISRGFSTGPEALQGLYHFCKSGTILICAWGDKGATACYRSTDTSQLHVVSSPALSDIYVVDSLGAGDTFVAGVIHTFMRGGSLCEDILKGEDHKVVGVIEEALKFGCRVAGVKCCVYGYDAIRELLSQ